MKQFRFEFQKNKKHFCPNCHKKRFVRYIDNLTNELLPEKYGRCDREVECGYFLDPYSDNYLQGKTDDELWIPKPTTELKPREISYINKEIVESTFHQFNSNVFFKYLVKTFGKETAFELQEKYNIGSAKHGGTVFWYQDNVGRFRSGKIMYYAENGKRRKDRFPNWVHSALKIEDYNLKLVFFGEHLTRGADKIALCESEKTAIMMNIFEPDFTWIASGGLQMVNDYRLNRLPKLTKIYPDNGALELWKAKTKHFNGRLFDTTVDFAVKNGSLKKGADILDLYLLNYEKKQSIRNRSGKVSMHHNGLRL